MEDKGKCLELVASVCARIGKLLEVNIDGKWQVATTGTSRFEFAGVMDDNGHKLIMISVLPEAKTVA